MALKLLVDSVMCVGAVIECLLQECVAATPERRVYTIISGVTYYKQQRLVLNNEWHSFRRRYTFEQRVE